MIKKRTLKKEKIKNQYKRKIEKSRKKKRSKKGLIRINQKSNRRSIKKTPHSKLMKVQTGKGWFSSSCGSEINVKKMNKLIDKTQKQFTSVKLSTKMFIDGLQLVRQYNILKTLYNLKKIKLLLQMQQIILKKQVPSLEKKEIELKTSTGEDININTSEYNSIITLISEIDNDIIENGNMYEGLVKLNKNELDDYAKQDTQRKKNLNSYYKEIYKYYTGKTIKKFNYKDKEKFNILKEIKKQNEAKNKKKKNDYKPGKTNGEIISFYKLKLGDRGEMNVKSLETIKADSKLGVYKNMSKLKQFHEKLAKCENDWKEKIKIHNKLFETISSIIEEDNNLQREIGNMSSYLNKIEIKIGGKSKTSLNNIFEYENSNYKTPETEKCIEAIFYLAPFEINEIQENKDIVNFKKEQQKIINYGKLKDIQENFEQITQIVNQMNLSGNKQIIEPNLNRAKNMFMKAKKLYDGIKSDLNSFKNSFFYVGKDKARGVNPTIHLLKQINSILSAHYEALFTINLVKCYMEIFINEEYQKKFLEFLPNTTQNPTLRAQYQKYITQRNNLQRNNGYKGGSMYIDSTSKIEYNDIVLNLSDKPSISHQIGRAHV